MRLKIKLTAVFSLIISILLLVGCNITTNQSVPFQTDTGLNVHIIDVGQGDSTLLECNNFYMLVDSGEAEYGKAVVDYLEKYNINTLNYFVITHPHSDHYGGAKTVLENIETENIIMSEAYSTTNSWENLIDYIDQNNFNVIMPKTSDTFTLDNCTVTAYVPNIDNDDLNNSSIVLKAEYNGMSALLTGDAEKAEEQAMLVNAFNLQANLLKVGHHGSSTSTSQEFLEKVNPQLALISCGKNNDYGHPHRETTSILNRYNIKTLRTDEQGDILVNLNNNTMQIYTANGYSNVINLNNSPHKAESTIYTGNKNSKVYHSSNCNAIDKMADKNKVIFSSVEEAENNGYTPCKNCNP